MAKISFVILAHENAHQVADLAKLLTEWDENAHAVIHYDLNASPVEFAKLTTEFDGSSRIHIVKDRIKCGWGNFSLVDATVRSLKLIRKLKIDCERVMLVSGACMPIRPLAELSSYLDKHPKTEFIESFDSSWITGGLRHERWQYWHFFNYQTQHPFFQAHYNTQRKIWPKRKFPRGLEPRYGSQWWCLTWGLCEKILDYVTKHPLVYFFFSTTWIPDEMFFQTMAFKFTPNVDLASRNLTFFHFNDWGKPLVFLDDHVGMFNDVPFFFARKISNRASKLRAELTAIAKGPVPEKPLKIDFKQRYIFPFKALMAEKKAKALAAPALFQFRSKSGWEAALDNTASGYVVLYGPPALTRLAAGEIDNRTDLTVFGRLFQPGKVDFGPGRDGFKGLHASDDMIRDFDAPGFFRRVLNRCDTMPVFELCPGDNPSAEFTLLQNRNAVVIPILPISQGDLMRQLYWILCSNLEMGDEPSQLKTGEQTPIQRFASMQRSVELSAPKDHYTRIEAFLKAARAMETANEQEWAKALEFQHGATARSLTEIYSAMEQVVGAARISDIVKSLPASWRGSFDVLSTPEPQWHVGRLSFPINFRDAGILSGPAREPVVIPVEKEVV